MVGSRGGGRAGHVEAGHRFAATTSQVCGLFPFATPSGSDVRGGPIGRHLHTAEPVGLDPAHWLRTGLVSNTGVWVQGQPGIGKSSITKRMLAGLVGFGRLVPKVLVTGKSGTGNRLRYRSFVR